MKKIGIIERYQEFLPKVRKECIISLNEGNTPLILAEALPKFIGQKNLKFYYKFEGLNPTGSFKDRGMTLAISKAFEKGAKAVICASTGNTSASAAAFSSRCRLKCYVLIPDGKIAKGKLLQAYRYGAKIILIKGNFDQALQIAKELSEKEDIELVNSINPYRIEGQKTAAFEIVDDLGEAPDYQAVPVGNAGNITAYWKGYKEYKLAGKSNKLPKMIGFQAEGSAPLVKNKIIDKPETIATAIRIGNPANWNGAIAARDESQGLIDSVSDEEIIEAYKFIAEKEGIFAEPASAASVAGVIKLAKKKYFKEGSTIVMTLTGSGLKDPDFALSFNDEVKIVEANYDSVKSILQD
ncbi:MAG: threonine synthase [Candidatus Pacearchaeota archaeon]